MVGTGFYAVAPGAVSYNTALNNYQSGFTVTPGGAPFNFNAAIGNGGPGVIFDLSSDPFTVDVGILECTQSGIIPLVPKSMTSNSLAAGRFEKQDFIYIAEDDEYRCPAGQRAIWRFRTVEDGLTIDKYWSSACPRCPMKAQCTTGEYRRITRWKHEVVLEAMQERLDRKPDSMRVRRRTVEHPFGTLKFWMGAVHFLTKTLPRVSTEMSLQVLAYNLKRVMQILGIGEMLRVLRA